MKNQVKFVKPTGSHWHRVLTWAVLIGIFICGVMAGAFIWQKHVNTAKCAPGNDLVVEEKDLSACEMKERALLANLRENIDDSALGWAINSHKHNAEIYERLSVLGCTENSGKYEKLKNAELEVFNALASIGEVYADKEPCKEIEDTLLRNDIMNGCDQVECHLNNAKAYSKMVKSGCKENQQKYAQKALGELQIADGIKMNNYVSEDEMVTTVNVYKNLDMKNEAIEYIQKIETLQGYRRVIDEMKQFIEQ